MGTAFLDKKGGDKGLGLEGITGEYYVYDNEVIKKGDFVQLVDVAEGSEETFMAKLATSSPFDGIAKTSGKGATSSTSADKIKVISSNRVLRLTNFTDTSLFNIYQNSTRTLVKEQTPISNSFIRLGYNNSYPASGFSLADKEGLQFDGNIVAVVMYKYTSDTTGQPRMGWNTDTSGYAIWNVTSSSFWNGFPKREGWSIHRVKWDRINYNKVRTAGCFGFCQLDTKDNVVLDIAGISFYKVSDSQYNDSNFINSLGV